MEYDLFGNEIIEERPRRHKNVSHSEKLQNIIDKIDNFDELETAFRALQSKFDEIKNSRRIIENDSFTEQLSFENEELRQLGRKGLDEVSSDGRSSTDTTPESSIDEPRKFDGELREGGLDNKLNSQQILSANNSEELGVNKLNERNSDDGYNGADTELFGGENNTSSIRSGNANTRTEQQSMESVSASSGVSHSQDGISNNSLPDLDIPQMDISLDKQESKRVYNTSKTARDENISSSNTRTNENRVDDLFADGGSESASSWGESASSATSDEDRSILRSLDKTSTATHENDNRQQYALDEKEGASEFLITSSGTNEDYVSTNNEVITGKKAKFNATLKAIKLAKELQAIKANNEERFTITKEEQEILSKFSGFGGLAEVFDESKTEWEKERNELKQTLSNEEYISARQSIYNAFYTPKIVIDTIHKSLNKMGLVDDETHKYFIPFYTRHKNILEIRLKGALKHFDKKVCFTRIYAHLLRYNTRNITAFLTAFMVLLNHKKHIANAVIFNKYYKG